MTTLTLPLPEGPLTLHATLGLISKLEREKGSIFLLAEKLAARELPLTDIIRILHMLYREAGSALEEEPLATFFLSSAPVTAPVLLANIFSSLISPLRQMGVSPQGEP